MGVLNVRLKSSLTITANMKVIMWIKNIEPQYEWGYDHAWFKIDLG